MTEPKWSLDEAIALVREVEELVRPLGFYTGLTGSVLYKGMSNKDLDIIVAPLDASKPLDLALLRLMLQTGMGWVCTHSEEDIKKIWRKKGSTDTKYVEAWKTPDGRRVDIMVLK